MEDRIKTIAGWLAAGSINVFGPPLAGKDTQARKLAELLGGPVIAGGEILRSYPDQTRLKALLSTGELIPTDLYFEILLPYLSRPDFAGKPLFLSAVGRWQGEETTIMKAAADSGHPIKAAIYLEVPEEELRQRLELALRQQDRGQRDDDRLEVLGTRLSEFRSKTLPVVDYYRGQGLLITVDGTRSPEDVSREIVDRLAEQAAGRQ